MLKLESGIGNKILRISEYRHDREPVGDMITVAWTMIEAIEVVQ